jgi:hypothetical protein
MQCACAQSYCYLWLVWLYHVFSTLSHKQNDIRKTKIIEYKMFGFISGTTFVWNITILRRIQRDIILNVHSSRYSCEMLMKLEFSWQIFEKYSNIELHENPSIGSGVFFRTDRWTDRHDESNCRFFAILRTRVRIVQLVNNASPQTIMSWHYIKEYSKRRDPEMLGDP